jgi:hypothetical protein
VVEEHLFVLTQLISARIIVFSIGFFSTGAVVFGLFTAGLLSRGVVPVGWRKSFIPIRTLPYEGDGTSSAGVTQNHSPSYAGFGVQVLQVSPSRFCRPVLLCRIPSVQPTLQSEEFIHLERLVDWG